MSSSEQSIERQKLFCETLQSIDHARKKLQTQYNEFDHLSVELKMKLDDKEVTVDAINESFRVLKKNVLDGAADSRTGQVCTFSCVWFMCVCVCVCEREIERER